MVGRASLIVILGFSMLIGSATRYWTYASGKAVSNVTHYYYSTIAHDGAVAGANMICDSIFQNPGDTTLIINGNSLTGTFPDGGSYWIVAQMQPGLGKYRNCQITSHYSNAVPGDMTYIDSVVVLLGPYAFSRYAFYTNNDSGVNWTTGDTLTGPYQSNGSMNVTGVPVIKGPVTLGRNVYNSKSVGYPKPDTAWAQWENNKDTLICNSFKSGVTDSLPTAFDSSVTICDTTKVFSNSSNADTTHSLDVYLTFDTTNGGSVKEVDTTRVLSYVKVDSTYNSGTHKYTYTYGYRSTGIVSVNSPPKITLSSIKNNKTGEVLILVNNGDAHVKGVVEGDVSVVAMQPTTKNRQSYTSTLTSNSYFDYQEQPPYNQDYQSTGNILVDGSITYASGVNGSDMLGLIASNSVMLTNQSSSVTIDAAIFALKGSFTYEDYTTSSKLGYLNVNGSLVQYKRGAVGQVGGTGYLKNYKYDTRYRYNSPPGFPLSRRFVVYSWRE